VQSGFGAVGGERKNKRYLYESVEFFREEMGENKWNSRYS
jgi:hypothetical protein